MNVVNMDVQLVHTLQMFHGNFTKPNSSTNVPNQRLPQQWQKNTLPRLMVS
jgi:hypothetical protein